MSLRSMLGCRNDSGCRSDGRGESHPVPENVGQEEAKTSLRSERSGKVRPRGSCDHGKALNPLLQCFFMKKN